MDNVGVEGEFRISITSLGGFCQVSAPNTRQGAQNSARVATIRTFIAVRATVIGSEAKVNGEQIGSENPCVKTLDRPTGCPYYHSTPRRVAHGVYQQVFLRKGL